MSEEKKTLQEHAQATIEDRDKQINEAVVESREEAGLPTEQIPLYVQRTDCTEEQVNALIQLGYTPWQITPVVEIVKRNGIISTENTKLIYHFIRRKQ